MIIFPQVLTVKYITKFWLTAQILKNFFSFFGIGNNKIMLFFQKIKNLSLIINNFIEQNL